MMGGGKQKVVLSSESVLVNNKKLNMSIIKINYEILKFSINVWIKREEIC